MVPVISETTGPIEEECRSGREDFFSYETSVVMAEAIISNEEMPPDGSIVSESQQGPSVSVDTFAETAVIGDVQCEWPVFESIIPTNSVADTASGDNFQNFWQSAESMVHTDVVAETSFGANVQIARASAEATISANIEVDVVGEDDVHNVRTSLETVIPDSSVVNTIEEIDALLPPNDQFDFTSNPVSFEEMEEFLRDTGFDF